MYKFESNEETGVLKLDDLPLDHVKWYRIHRTPFCITLELSLEIAMVNVLEKLPHAEDLTECNKS